MNLFLDGSLGSIQIFYEVRKESFLKQLSYEFLIIRDKLWKTINHDSPIH